jgi:hypothetical protein
MYTVGSGMQDGVNLGTANPATRKRAERVDGVEPGHTPRPMIRSKGAHAVEFSKTVAPLQKGLPSQGRPGPGIRIPKRTGEYSARSTRLEKPRGRRAAPRSRRIPEVPPCIEYRRPHGGSALAMASDDNATRRRSCRGARRALALSRPTGTPGVKPTGWQ